MDKNIENIKMNLQEIESKLQGCINFTKMQEISNIDLKLKQNLSQIVNELEQIKTNLSTVVK